MDFTKIAGLVSKDLGTAIATLILVALFLVYFKYVKHPDDALAEELKDFRKDFDALKIKYEALEDSFDAYNRTRISEATRNEQTLEKLEELRTKVAKIEEKISDIRVELATLSSRK